MASICILWLNMMHKIAKRMRMSILFHPEFSCSGSVYILPRQQARVCTYLRVLLRPCFGLLRSAFVNTKRRCAWADIILQRSSAWQAILRGNRRRSFFLSAVSCGGRRWLTAADPSQRKDATLEPCPQSVWRPSRPWRSWRTWREFISSSARRRFV